MLNRERGRTSILLNAPRTVVGYHGCSRENAATILAERRLFHSTNTYDWLGEGVYFWEYAPHRARAWAEDRYGQQGIEPAVIGATIRLGRCLNLLDTEHLSGLEDLHRSFIDAVGSERIPRNTNAGAHYLDRYIIDAYCRLIAEQSTDPFHTVRGCFPEGDPIYPGSKILKKTHTQIAVRDPICISRIHLVQFP